MDDGVFHQLQRLAHGAEVVMPATSHPTIKGRVPEIRDSVDRPGMVYIFCGYVLSGWIHPIFLNHNGTWNTDIPLADDNYWPSRESAEAFIEKVRDTQGEPSEP